MRSNSCVLVVGALILTLNLAQSQTGQGSFERLDPAFDSLVPKNASIEKVAGGFDFVEAPLWRSDRHIWFSDVVGNVLRSVTPDGRVEVLMRDAGGKTNVPHGGYVGPNGMVGDKDGTVLMCQHTNRRIVRVAKDLNTTVYLDKFEGKRFNSPNDLVFRSDGTLYFTDPPFGLPKGDADPAKEIKFNGVYRYANGKLEAAIKDLPSPNGIALSPDGKILYVSNTQKDMYWMRYNVGPDGSISGGRKFADVSPSKDSGVPDGMKVDSKGNIYATGPGGILVFSPSGKHLGTIRMPEVAANCGWGEDRRTLYITASTSVYRVRLAVAGEKPVYP
ncbi:MAG: SMP-30/gluconolactonase/LRE family protein [Bryobacteraceae bacterium]